MTAEEEARAACRGPVACMQHSRRVFAVTNGNEIIGKALNPGDVSFQMAARQFADELILARKEGR